MFIPLLGCAMTKSSCMCIVCVRACMRVCVHACVCVCVRACMMCHDINISI